MLQLPENLDGVVSMNFLAHLYLSSDEPEALAGSLLPDLTRGPLPANLSPVLEGACRLHRLIDSFTDTHPIVAASKERIRHRHGRFSGILIDIFYDHYLARDWHRYHAQSLPDFTRNVYDALLAQTHHLPAGMDQAVVRMAQQDWLCSYASTQGIRLTLERMSRRFTQRFDRPINLAPAADELQQLDRELGADFHAFFPQLMAFACAREPAVSRDMLTLPLIHCKSGLTCG